MKTTLTDVSFYAVQVFIVLYTIKTVAVWLG